MSDLPFRLRVRFSKGGRLRFLSHLEVTRACERSARRAGLPYAVTQGFNPKMRIAFGPALPVGTGGNGEFYDLWLREYVPPAEAFRALLASTPESLAPIEAYYVSYRAPSLTAALTIAAYEVEVDGGGSTESLQRALDSVVSDGELAVEHRGKRKVFELASALPKEPCVRSVSGRNVVEITTRMGDRGSLRPETLVMAAIRQSGAEGTVLSVMRTDLAEE